VSIQIKVRAPARRALARFHKDDRGGVEQVIDSVNLLRSDPNQGVKWGAYRRLHVGVYRVLFQVIDGDPVVVSIEHVGR
jgi:mRNA-degrading endonuclease RelE of RelBE toxin-antitoxin system